MKDRNWMLNPRAIGAARKCIHITQIELGVSLKLSHPQFIEMLSEYADLTDSPELQESLVELMAYYNDSSSKETNKSLFSKKETNNVAIPNEPSIKKYIREAGKPSQEEEIPILEAALADGTNGAGPQGQRHMTEYLGKMYPTYNHAGKKFRGLYRGQPRYA